MEALLSGFNFKTGTTCYKNMHIKNHTYGLNFKKPQSLFLFVGLHLLLAIGRIFYTKGRKRVFFLCPYLLLKVKF